MNHIEMRYHANMTSGSELQVAAADAEHGAAEWYNRPGPGGQARSDFAYGDSRRFVPMDPDYCDEVIW